MDYDIFCEHCGTWTVESQSHNCEGCGATLCLDCFCEACVFKIDQQDLED